jgi:hypothetical protein
MMNTNDWNKYREEFPERYWQEGAFDEKLSVLLEQFHKTHHFNAAADVGGGVLGTLALRKFAQKHDIVVDLLDPYISYKPSWMREHIGWDNDEQYNLIVARGSINYLTLIQLQKLKEMMAPNGILIANTFLNPPSQEWSEREATNMLGEKGIERSRLVRNVVEHQVTFPRYSHKHTFFYYPLEQYQNVFEKVEVDTYGKNSSLIIVRK